MGAEQQSCDLAGGAEQPKTQVTVLKGEDLDDTLEVRVELPKIESIAGMNLEVSEDLLSLEVGGVYELALPLTHRVDDEEVGATFDKAQKVLVVTMPIKEHAAWA